MPSEISTAAEAVRASEDHAASGPGASRPPASGSSTPRGASSATPSPIRRAASSGP